MFVVEYMYYAACQLKEDKGSKTVLLPFCFALLLLIVAMISTGIFLAFFTAASAAARIPQRQNLEAKLGLCDDLNRHFNLWEKCCKTYWTTVTVTSTLTRVCPPPPPPL